MVKAIWIVDRIKAHIMGRATTAVTFTRLQIPSTRWTIAITTLIIVRVGLMCGTLLKLFLVGLSNKSETVTLSNSESELIVLTSGSLRFRSQFETACLETPNRSASASCDSPARFLKIDRFAPNVFFIFSPCLAIRLSSAYRSVLKNAIKLLLHRRNFLLQCLL